MRSDVVQGEGKKALVIAISDYTSLPRLEFCLNDGDEISHLLRSLKYEIPSENMLIGKIDYITMRTAIIRFFTDDNINPGDLLFFYFSGHATIAESGKNFLATSEIDPDKPYKNGFSFEDLTEMANESRSNKIVIVLDCCYSGGAIKGDKASPEAAANIGKNAIDASIIQRVKEKVCILASSRGVQESYGFKDLNHSLYTSYLIEGLKGVKKQSVDSKGNVTPKLLDEFVSEKMMCLPIQVRPKQKPISKLVGFEELELAHHPEFVTISNKSDSADLLILLKDGKIDEFNKIRYQNGYSELNFADADLKQKELDGANLKRTNFDDADLQGAKLRSVNLTNTSLQRANLRNAHIHGAIMRNTNLQKADLRGAQIHGVNISDTDFGKADLTGARLIGVDFDGVVNFISAVLRKAAILGPRFSGIVNFSGAVLDEASIMGSRINGIVTFANLEAINNVQISGITGNKGIIDQKFEEPINVSIEIVESPAANEYIESLRLYKKHLINNYNFLNSKSEAAFSLQKALRALQSEVENIDSREELDEMKLNSIDSKINCIVQKTFGFLPKDPDLDLLFASLNPFSNLIGKPVLNIFRALEKAK